MEKGCGKSYKVLWQRLAGAKDYDIKVTLVNESSTSSICSRCGSKHIIKRKKLFKYLGCGLEDHRAAVGCVNILLAQGTLEGDINSVVTRSLFLRSAETLETKNSLMELIILLPEARFSITSV